MPSIQSQKLFTLPDLPTELLLEIFLRLQELGLYHLGFTCHELQFLCFHTFLTREAALAPSLISNDRETQTLTVSKECHPLTWPIIHTSLWFQKYPRVIIHMSADALKDLFNTKKVVQRLEPRSVTLDFRRTVPWAWPPSSWNEGYKPTWMKVFQDLLDMVTLSSVWDFALLGGREL
ncbi:hypothetical protein CPB83DRAFT_123832 [Crepidotus variabilis]|uniref:F-box domain-containing protein n=1 Tax=Crepidotus variabilis TaxID=179855 RepID=A0A9P6JSU2_9AGAR|nr:hypothetical protein CPB83DRAFT_123832 [Crepidotus variabilis]